MYSSQTSQVVLPLHVVIKLDVVDLVGGVSLEALVDEGILFFSHVELHAIEDRSESTVANESTVALVLVLEEGLD